MACEDLATKKDITELKSILLQIKKDVIDIKGLCLSNKKDIDKVSKKIDKLSLDTFLQSIKNLAAIALLLTKAIKNLNLKGLITINNNIKLNIDKLLKLGDNHFKLSGKIQQDIEKSKQFLKIFITDKHNQTRIELKQHGNDKHYETKTQLKQYINDKHYNTKAELKQYINDKHYSTKVEIIASLKSQINPLATRLIELKTLILALNFKDLNNLLSGLFFSLGARLDVNFLKINGALFRIEGHKNLIISAINNSGGVTNLSPVLEKLEELENLINSLDLGGGEVAVDFSQVITRLQTLQAKADEIDVSLKIISPIIEEIDSTTKTTKNTLTIAVEILTAIDTSIDLIEPKINLIDLRTANIYSYAISYLPTIQTNTEICLANDAEILNILFGNDSNSPDLLRKIFNLLGGNRFTNGSLELDFESMLEATGALMYSENNASSTSINCIDLIDVTMAIATVNHFKSGHHRLPASLPKLGDEGEEIIYDAVTMNSFLLNQLDNLLGEFPLKIKIKNIEGAEEEIELPNVAESLAETFTLVASTAQASEIHTQLLVNNLIETRNNFNTTLLALDHAEAITDFLGYRGNEYDRKVRCSYTPKAANMQDFLKPTDINIVGWKIEDKEDLKALVLQTIRLCSIIRGAFFVPWNKMEGNIPGDLTAKDRIKDKEQFDEDWDKFIQELKKEVKDKPERDVKDIS